MTGTAGDGFARRVVEVVSDKFAGAAAGWTVGSGLLVGPRLVLTSAHVLTGSDIRVRGISTPSGRKVSWSADVIDPGDVGVADIALLRLMSVNLDEELADHINRLPMLTFARVDRGTTIPQVIAGCSAIGFPRFRETSSPGYPVVRETAHVTGEIPTLDQLVAGLLTLRVSSSPRPLPALDQPLYRSEWAGMSGAVVTIGDTVLGVVTEHQPRAGQSELTVTPVSHAGRLGTSRAAVWSAALGADVNDLPTASGTSTAPIQHFHIARDLVMSQTVVQGFRARPVAPSPPVHFAGRRTELDQLARSLRQGRNVTITGIQGMGGIGKTALALKLAEEMTEFNVVLWASLGPEPSAVNHLLNWARHADPNFQAGDTPLDVLAARVRAALTDLVRDRYPGPVLVILDDVWDGPAVTAARLLQSASPVGSVHLITTRSQLVVAQLRSTRLDLRPMEPADALQMLRNLLSAYPDIAAQDLLDLAAVVGHHPLAIELAAGQTQLLERPAEEIVDLLARYRGGVPAGSPFRQIRLELGESREDNLELVLSFSYEALDPADQADLRALGALAYGASFDRALCAAIWQREPGAVLDRLRHLALLGMAADRGWYQQHALLRSYARALLHAIPDQRSAVEDSYTRFVTELSSGFVDRSADRWADLEPYIPHVAETGELLVDASRAALEEQRPGDPLLDRMVEFAVRTRSLLSARRELDHREWLESGLVICRQRMDLGRVTMLLGDIAQQLGFRGDVPGAARALNEARDVAETARDNRAAAKASLDIGQFLVHADPDAAIRPLREALDAYQRLGDAHGMTLTLLGLAEWHAAWPHEPGVRQRASGPLAQARLIAEREGYTDLRGEALLGQGRLHHTFGDPAEAVPVLMEGVAGFSGLRNKAREAVARLFLAGSLADLGRLDRAEEELSKAVPLFSAVGDAPGQATGLRNLGELYARHGRPGQALASFAAALPLVHKLTMRYLDEDTEDPSVVPGFFTAQLEQVIGTERAEQFRARATLETTAEPESPGDGGGNDDGPLAGTAADELVGYLLTTTVRSATGPPADRAEWSAALAEFVERVSAHGDAFRYERDFAAALRDVVEARQVPQADLLVGNPYATYLPEVVARVGRRGIDVPLLSDEEVERYRRNTFAVHVNHPEHRKDWETELRKSVRDARRWGDEAEERLFTALLAVLASRPAGLPPGNPYHARFSELVDSLDEFERRPADLVVETTVAVIIRDADSTHWLETLSDRYRDAQRRHSDEEAALLAAMISLVTSGSAKELAETNPYRDLVVQAVRSVARGTPLSTLAPIAVLRALAGVVIEARTTRPKNVDEVAWQLAEESKTAELVGRMAEAQLYHALIDVVHGNTVAVPDTIYGRYVQALQEAVRDRQVAPFADHTLPDTQVERLVEAAVSVATEATNGAREPRDVIEDYHADITRRGPDWRPEADFLHSLTNLVDGHPTALPSTHPYYDVVAKAIETVGRHHAIQALGGHFTGAELDYFLDGTRRRLQAPLVLAQNMSDQADGFVDTLNRASGLVREQDGWKEEVHAYRMETEAKHPEWVHEAALLTALVDLLDTKPAGIRPDSPYNKAFGELLESIPSTYERVDFLATLAATRDEHHRLFRNRVTGRDRFVRNIPIALANTVVVRTMMADRATDWLEQLGHHATILIEQVSDLESFDAELALLEALRDATSGGRPTLPDDHPYHIELRQVVDGIDLFEGKLAWPGGLSGGEVRYLMGKTGAAMSFDSAHADEWMAELSGIRDEQAQFYPDDTQTRAFLDALLIVMHDRPADLPLTNPYWSYLHNIQSQIARLRETGQ